MADYVYDDDGNVHTRYSELMRCTPGQIGRVIAEREGARRVETASMVFGTDRHEMWADEALKTGKVPKCFGLDWEVSHVEKEFAYQLMPGIVLHFRPDIVCESTFMLPDFKTVLSGVNGHEHNLKKYQTGAAIKQLESYTFGLGLHGIKINELAFLCEIWNGDRTKIIGYRVIKRKVSLFDVGVTMDNLRKRALFLKKSIEAHRAFLVANS